MRVFRISRAKPQLHPLFEQGPVVSDQEQIPIWIGVAVDSRGTR